MSHALLLATQALSKRFGKRLVVNDLNLEVYKGDIFGFLGPNGAGKSTTIRMLFGLVRPTSGKIEIFGHTLSESRKKALRRVCGIVERPDFYLRHGAPPTGIILSPAKCSNLNRSLWDLSSIGR